MGKQLELGIGGPECWGDEPPDERRDRLLRERIAAERAKWTPEEEYERRAYQLRVRVVRTPVGVE